jgi:hypothetical protein
MLRQEFQVVLDTMVDDYKTLYGTDIVLQLGWKSATADLAVVAGNFSIPGVANSSRKATVQDTLLYGSGTKPLTAASVLRLIDQGKIQAYDLAYKIIDPFLNRTNGTTMAELFGPNINNATVLDVLRMAAGIPDFEYLVDGTYEFDNQLLVQGQRVWTPYDYLHYAASIPKSYAPVGHLYCDPGNCTAYSSTSYQVAGLLLTAVLNPDGDWMDLDMRKAALPDVDRYPSFNFMSGKGVLSDNLTIPGISTSDFWEDSIIWGQNPSVLGWTCGNLVANAQDLARWFYDLLDPSPGHPHIVSGAAREEMMRLDALSYGWGEGAILYGAGLMQVSTDRNRNAGYAIRGSPLDGGYSIGHGGETFGFNSFQGYSAKLGAAYTIVVNNDLSDNAASRTLCYIMEIAGNATGVPTLLDCKRPKLAEEFQKEHAAQKRSSTPSTVFV